MLLREAVPRPTMTSRRPPTSSAGVSKPTSPWGVSRWATPSPLLVEVFISRPVLHDGAVTPSRGRPVQRPCGTRRSLVGPTLGPTGPLRLRSHRVPWAEGRWTGGPAAGDRRGIRRPRHGEHGAARDREHTPVGVRWFARRGRATWGGTGHGS